MSDELNEETSGLSRRSMIKRGALVGGTLVWAQPVVQGFGTAAGAQTNEGSPVDGPFEGWSYIAVTFTCGGSTVYKAKFELDDSTGDAVFVGAGNTPGTDLDCTPEGFGTATQATADQVSISQVGDEVTVTILCTDGAVVDGSIKSGSEQSSGDNECANGTNNGGSITFDTNDVGPQA